MKKNKNLLLSVMAVLCLIYIYSCEKQEIYNYQRDDYAIIEVMYEGKPVAMVGAIPGDTVKFGDYTIVYTKRK